MSTTVNHQYIQEAIAARLQNIHAALQQAGFDFDRTTINNLFGGEADSSLSSAQQAVIAQTAQSYDRMLSYALTHNGETPASSVSEGLMTLSGQQPERQSALQKLAGIFSSQAESLASGQPVDFGFAQMGNSAADTTTTVAGATETIKQTTRRVAPPPTEAIDWAKLGRASREQAQNLLDTFIAYKPKMKARPATFPTVERLQRSVMQSVQSYIKQHNELTENIRKTLQQIESHAGIQNAINNLRKYAAPTSMLEAQWKKEAGDRLNELLSHGQLASSVKLYGTNVRQLAELQERMQNYQSGQPYLKQHARVLNDDAEVLQQIETRLRGLKPFEVNHNGKRLEAQLAYNAKLLAADDQREYKRTYQRPGERMR